MGTLLAFVVILLVSVVAVRIGSLALRRTGLRPDTASFQAYSAFFGVGFTTREAELVVNHPVRRRIIRDLILAGNVGLTSALATVVITLMQASNWDETVNKGAWLLGIGLGLFILSRFKIVMRLIDWTIERAMRRMGGVHPPEYEFLLRVESGYGVAECEVTEGHWLVGKTLGELHLTRMGVMVLGIARDEVGYIGAPHGDARILPGDVLTVYGQDEPVGEVFSVDGEELYLERFNIATKALGKGTGA